MVEILITRICKKCECTYYSYGETNAKGFCPTCLISYKDIKSQEVTIVPALLDVSQLGEVEHKNLWKPESFDDYVGQESLKNILNGYIKGCKELNRPFPHFLVDGKAGIGKTTITYILAKQLGLTFVECVANTVKSQ